MSENSPIISAYKFVEHDVPPLESLKSSRIYQALEQAAQGNLTLLKEMYQPCGFGIEYLLQGSYRLSGWCFNLRSYCKTYLVKLRHEEVYRTYRVPNKTCLYRALGGRHLVADCVERIEKP